MEDGLAGANVKLAADPLDCGFSEAGAERVVGDHKLDGVGKGDCVALWDHEAFDTVIEDFRDRACVSSNDRATGGHGFKKGSGDSVFVSVGKLYEWCNEDVGVGEVLTDLRS